MDSDQRARLLSTEGGSLNTIASDGAVVTKEYRGTLARGYEKLAAEHAWLTAVPAEIQHGFARPIGYWEDVADDGMRTATLQVEAVPDSRTVAKAILLDELSPQQTADAVRAGLGLLVDGIYRVRKGSLPGAETYQRFHAGRVAHAVLELATVPGVREVATASRLTVNGVPCPTLPQIARDLAQAAERWEEPTGLVAGHGDAHIDNLLISTSVPGPVWVDPRGDDLLPPHYDTAKMLKAVRAGYDLIHYGFYELRERTRDAGDIRLTVEPTWDAHYGAALAALTKALPGLADAEKLPVETFRARVAVAEIAHVMSFAWYHANRPGGCDIPRVIAYVAVAALLARRLADGDTRWDRPLLERSA